MKKISLLLSCILFTFSAWAQIPGDTIVVQSLVHSSQTRDTMVAFPNLPNVTFEKIIMQYNMRCKGALVSTVANRNLGCGEWDYSCNTFITDSTKTDSTARTTDNYVVPGLSGTTLAYTTAPINDYYRMIQPSVSVNTIVSETQATVGASNANIMHAVPTSNYGAKSQYLFTAAELLAAGAVAGNLNGILLNVNTAGLNANFLKVKIKNSTKTQLSASTPDSSGFTEVFFHNTNLTVGSNRLQFNTPFVWNGTSNIIVEFSFTNATGGASNVVLAGSATTNPMGIHSQDEKLIYFKNDNYLEATNYQGIGGNQSRTIEAWIKTSMGDNEIVSWGRNAANVKWTFRLDGSGRLRLENGNGGIVGTTVLNDNKWHHVACTFNGTTLNDVILFADGQLETNSSNSGTLINTDIINGIPLRVSRGTNNRYFEGNIDDVRIWDTDLSTAAIQNWMHKKLDASHPNMANLRLHYLINAGSGTSIADQSGQGNDAIAVNGAYWQTTTGERHFKNFIAENERPNISFLQGTYTTTTTNDTAWLAVEQIPYLVRQATIVPHPGTLIDDEIIYSPVVNSWNNLPGERYYDESNMLIQTTPVVATASLTISPLPYTRRDAMQFDIMSFVTPYGINLDFGQDGRTWHFDLTDFSPIFKGDKRMLLTFGGQNQEEMDIKFLFIVGTPPHDVMDINNIWSSIRSSTYTDINNDVVFPPRDLQLAANANSFKIRTTVTGHGQDGEFIPRNHYINIDGGSPEYTWQAWKECAANPVYPQGGTWIYDRAGWCPGMATDLQEFWIDQYVTPGQIHNFDYNVDVASGDSRYIVSHQLVNYGAPNHAVDARITDIINPSSKIEHARENPMCFNPKVMIQNTGSTTLTSVDIDYWVNAGTKKRTHTWNGSLDFMQSTEVELPVYYDFWDDLTGPNGNVFYAETKKANGIADEYSLNNKMSSAFEVTGVFPNQFVLQYTANAAFAETKIEVIDDQQNVVFSKIATSRVLTRDTITVGNGCHSLLITDTDDDGIDFFANNDSTGQLFIRSLSNSLLYRLEGDFGKYSKYNFTVNYPLSYEQLYKTLNVKIYPNPTDDFMYIEATDIGDAEVVIYNSIGKKLNVAIDRNQSQLKLNTAALASGMYFVELRKGEQYTSKKFLVTH